MNYGNKEILMEEQNKNIDEIGEIAAKLREHAINIDSEIEK